MLRPKLREYLKMKGVDVREDGFFSCIHPNHPDIHPSCSIGGNLNEEVFHCFSGGHSGNIFHAVHYLEGKPITGLGFFQETLPYLCHLFDIPYEPIQISEDKKREFQKRRAYKDAVTLVHSMIFEKRDGTARIKSEHPAIRHLSDRGIDEATIRKFKIGCVDSFDKYLSDMRVMGWTDRSYLEGADLANKKIFSPTGVIIPIHDDKGREVGFVTRKTTTAANEKTDEKYFNSLNSDIYHKSEILFNFNRYERDKGPLFVVEGYLDAVYLTQVGIPNVAAIGATMLTEEHVDMLFNHKVKDIILCFDADDGGRRGTKLAIERLSCYKTFKVRVIELPNGDDPDTFVRTNGKDRFLALSKATVALSPFAWMLKHTTFEDDPMETAKTAIPTIAAEESNITRLQMIRDLARLTGLDEQDIRKDVDALVNRESSKFIEEIGDVNNYVQVQLAKRKTRDTKSILEEAVLKIKTLERQYNNSIDNKGEYIGKVEDIKDRIESGNFKYGLRPAKFRKFYELFDGIPYSTCLTLIGGRPSAGKTSLMTALAMDTIDCEEEAVIFYMSIDDTTELMVLKMLAMKSGLSTSEIKRYTELQPEKKQLVDMAWAWVEANSDRLIIADTTAGNSLDALSTHMDWFTKNYKTPKKLFLLDNFHKLRGSSYGQSRSNKAQAASEQSERIKEITQLNDIHLMMTVELRKLENSTARPQPNDMKDTVQLEYDADIVVLVHNDYQVNENSMLVWDGSYNGVQDRMPYLETRIWKNKMTGKTGSIGYKLNTYNLRIEEVPISTLTALIANKDQGRHVVKAGRLV